jgi:hypothetical protein
MPGTPPFAKPAEQMIGTRRGYKIMWSDCFSRLGSCWDVAPTPGLQDEPRLYLPLPTLTKYIFEIHYD